MSRSLYRQSLQVMKAIRVHQHGGPEVLTLDHDVPVPRLGPEDVLVRVKAAGINPVDTYIRSGQYPRTPSLPYTPGGDCAGIIEDIGDSVSSRLRKGQRVFVARSKSGSYAEYTLALQEHVHSLSEELTFSQGAAIGTPYLTAYRALVTKMSIRPGEIVLIHGASGGVGIASVQIAKAYGAVVIGSAGTDEGQSVVRQAGAHHVVNHRDPTYIDKIKEITAANGGVDAILENNAHINLAKDLQLLARNGRVAVVGNRGSIEINPRDTMVRESSIMGVMMFGATESELRESFAAIEAGIDNKWLKPIVGKTFPLSNASEGHYDIINGKGAVGKTVLTVD